jgi:tRNA A37 threonylcarbamoyladenosine dehydratase
MTVAVLGTGGAGTAVARLLIHAGVGDLSGFDREACCTIAWPA